MSYIAIKVKDIIKNNMNKILTLAFATILLASCNSKKSDYRGQHSIADIYYCDLEKLSDDSDCYDDIPEVSESSVKDYSNYYYVDNNGGGSITIHDLDGNYYYIDIDGSGNLSAHDLNGNFYHSYTDDFGNTSGYDSDGNFYHSYTDDFGNTTGYDSDGNFYSAYSDDFGNTTINVY